MLFPLPALKPLFSVSRDLVPMTPSLLLALSLVQPLEEPCTQYLYREEGGKPLPELHLRVTAEVPVEGTGRVTAQSLGQPRLLPTSQPSLRTGPWLTTAASRASPSHAPL